MRLTSVDRAAAFCAMTLALAVNAQAAPVLNPANGHYYDLVDNSALNWTQAAADARTRHHRGFQGHLVTITSAEEDAFLIDTFGVSRVAGRWIGGFQNVTASGYSEPAGGWSWVTGEPWSYQHWAEGEPNDWGGGENWLQIWDAASPSWNDIPDNVEVAHSTGYIVEYERSNNIGGSAVNTAIWRVRCQNLTTGETKQASVSGTSWDCGALGLSVSRGDHIKMEITGTANVPSGRGSRE